jgi:hypothetical protein
LQIPDSVIKTALEFCAQCDHDDESGSADK